MSATATAQESSPPSQPAPAELLRFVTCGSVDDGKSTLIGRLLLDTGAVYEDEIERLKADARRRELPTGELDPSLLLDGLEAEREQGITIDVAYRYFDTEKRRFIIADSPGHEQYTRNMATAASTADLAVILMDATKGVLPQTRRHSFIATLMGVKQIVVAINKMDLVDFDAEVFERIRGEYQKVADKLGIRDCQIVPMSARDGDNVLRRSDRTPWYKGHTLIELLEQADLRQLLHDEPFRLPVQYVLRKHNEYRGYAGSVLSGCINTGDKVKLFPSGRVTTVTGIQLPAGEGKTAWSGQAVSIALADEVDLSRGEMICDVEHPPHQASRIEAHIVWMSADTLKPGRPYWIKHTTRKLQGEFIAVNRRFDIASLDSSPASTLQQNEIGICTLELDSPISFDSYERNRDTGSFIVVDRVTHETAAAGMLLAPQTGQSAPGNWNDPPLGNRIRSTRSSLSGEQRGARFGQTPVTVLLTGLSGSGKTTVAYELEKRLLGEKRLVTVLDGENMRLGISRDLGFSVEERSENLRRATEIAKIINDSGAICLAAFVAPHAETRNKAKHAIGTGRFLMVHLKSSVDSCRERDETGRYAMADRGEIASFPGVTGTYEEPEDADLTLDTETQSVAECVDVIHQLLLDRGILTDVDE